MAVENYHLKWDSHVTYLNSSVATLYKNEKFADVVLYSSSSCSSNGIHGSNTIDNAIPTVGISAHKFILSSCSQFFATLFDNTPIPASNGVLYVVLPPELSHRAIQILVQYIYTGEATVSNDILTEVLRGGEILKIRGLCRTATQRESAGGTASCNNSIHFGTNGTRPQHLFPPTVIHGTSQHSATAAAAAALTTDLYTTGNKCNAQSLNGSCSARYGIEPVAHSQNSIHSQIRGLGASVMPKDSPVIVKSPKITPMGGQLPANRENKQHHASGGGGGGGGGGGITVNKEVAIDPDENCCYQAAIVPNILQHEPIQLPLPPPPAIVSMGGSSNICSDISCKNCSFNSPTEPEKQRLRQRHLSQSEELPPHRLPGIDRLEREYPDERGELSDVQLHFTRRSRNGNDRVSNFFITDQYDASGHAQAHLIAAAVKTPKQYEPSAMPTTTTTTTTAATVASNLHSPPLYPHNFLTIKQEPVDWTTPQSTPAENSDETVERPSSLATPPQPHDTASPKQQPPLDFKIPVGNTTTIKIEAGGTSVQDPDEEDDLTTGSAIVPYSDFSRLICDICKKSFEEPKLWVEHLESHTTATTAAATATATASTTTATPTNEANGAADTLNKSYVPKKRRRISQQENNMADHVTLLCDLCNTSFDTPAEWVRHMNNQHTEIELAMFNSKKDKEQNSTNSSSVMTCSSGSRNRYHHQSQQQQQQDQHHQQQTKQQTINKKYSNRSELPSTHNRSESNSSNSLHHTRKSGLVSSKILRSSSPTVVEQRRINVTRGPLSNNSLTPSPPSSQQ